MLVCKEIHVGGLEVALRISPQHMQIGLQFQGLTLLGAVSVEG